MEARRHDGSVAARFWLDRETALSVRRETFGTDGTLLSASAYVELAIKAMHPCCVDNGPTEVRVDEAALRDVDLDRMRRAGWHCPEHLGDGLTLYEARVLGEAVHLSYSDGVMTVSIFEQPGRLDPASLDGYTKTTVGDGVIYASAGPPARFTWSTGGRVVTVVADAPLEVIESVLRDMPPEASPAPKPDDGFFARISRGASRVASWLNPFD